MPTFPLREADVTALAQSLTAGLNANPASFPAPPVSPDQLQSALNAFIAAREDLLAAEAACQEARRAKNRLFDQLKTAIKTDLRYAEISADANDATLKLLGWGAARPKNSAPAPGQCLNLNASPDGPGNLKLTWRPPVDGGKALAYIVQRRDADSAWTDIATSLKPAASLTGQARAQTLEFRVTAHNKSGPGPASNTVSLLV